ncbi:MAG TPA: D-aminoacyl-tRNA deacylase [Bacteroidota bacterium]|jgi:D-tyrosyl-tRNA(Tyr) deacylase|nr:D-aminoacyl-tRNA deacylase [Bacteroidota bacterium]
MRALIQRVSRASVSIGGASESEIGKGMLIFLGVTHNDASEDAEYLADRCAALRIFEDDQGKMNLSVGESGGSALVVSQFTLYADTRKGNRPSFVDAARPEIAEQRYNDFVTALRSRLGEPGVRTGVFRAMMDVQLNNDGPVTIMLESKPKG